MTHMLFQAVIHIHQISHLICLTLPQHTILVQTIDHDTLFDNEHTFTPTMTESNPGYFPWSSDDTTSTLSAARSFFHEHGYAIFTAHATLDETTRLRAAAENVITNFHKSSTASSVFTTVDQTRKMDDTYFLASANNVSCFLEEAQERTAERPAINKIGHALHDLEPVFATFSRSKNVRCIAEAFEIPQPLLIQSMYILKSPRVGGPVLPHRDAAFVRGEPCATGECLGYWWALEDATLENGCLWAVPGSHKDGKTLRRFVLSEDGKMTKFVGEDDMRGYEDEDFVSLPMKAGDLIILHGALVHKSLPNRSEKSRHAYSIHVVSRAVPKDCWLQRREDFPAQPL